MLGLLVGMPHVRSLAAKAKRTFRALSLGFAPSCTEGHKVVVVKAEVHKAAQAAAKNLQLLYEHDKLAKEVNYHGRLASQHALDKGMIDSAEGEVAMGVHKQAGSLKHLISRKPRWSDTVEDKNYDDALPCVEEDLQLEGLENVHSRGCIADRCMASSALSAASRGDIIDSLPCVKEDCRIVDEDKELAAASSGVVVPGLSPHAPIFFPAGDGFGNSVPSIGAQLDFMLLSLGSQASSLSSYSMDSRLVQQLTDRVEQLEFKSKELEAKLAALEGCQDGQQTDLVQLVSSQVVGAVIGQLPLLISPVVEQSMKTCTGSFQATIESAVGSMRQSIIDSALCQIRAELDKSSSLPRKEGDIPKPKLVALPVKISDVKVKAESRAGCAPPCGEKCKDELPTGIAPRVVAPIAAPPTLPEGEFLEGEAVVLHGLTKSPELNGQSGLVLGFDSQARRYMVKLVTDVLGTLSDKTLRIKAGNLASADEVDFSADEADDMSSEEAVKSDPYKVSENICRLHRRSSGALSAQRAAALDMNYPDQ